MATNYEEALLEIANEDERLVVMTAESRSAIRGLPPLLGASNGSYSDAQYASSPRHPIHQKKRARVAFITAGAAVKVVRVRVPTRLRSLIGRQNEDAVRCGPSIALPIAVEHDIEPVRIHRWPVNET